MKRGTLLGLAGALALACASPPPPESALRADARAAAEAGSARLAGRHHAAAARSFARAAEVYGAIDDPVAEASALRNQGEALRRGGDLAAATAAFERALAIDLRGAWPGAPDAQARDLAGLARCASARGEVALAVEQAERGLGLVSGSEALRASLEVDLAVYLVARGNEGDRERVVQLLDTATRRAAASGEARTEAAARLNLGRAQRRFGSPERAEESLRLAHAGFRALDDPEGLARTHEELGLLMRERGRPEAARQHLERARQGYVFLGDEAALAHLDELLVEERR